MKILHTARPPDVEAPVRTRRMFVRDLALDCLIGVHRYERDGRQRVRINLSLDVLETGPVERDRLAEVVNYDTLVVRIRALAGDGHVNLVETFAERVAAICLEDRRVRRAVVRVEKLDVFDDAESVGVEIERENAAL
ncbi:MAG: dihydroneopterin aldolase [Defluviicoccus sp.]|nr:dihydroneopterin aldolase [Defluviicoccus sp.]MDE0275852.1 dihydroneopterin aldolase [Defluviicoccus sp.]